MFQPAEESTDSELVDLFLHPQDRAYSIPELYEFLDECELNLVDFLWAFRPFYDLLEDTPLAEMVAGLPRRERHAVAEIYWGTISQHAFWASRHPTPQADLDNVPFFAQTVQSLRDVREKILAHHKDEFPIQVTNKGVEFTVTLELTPVVRRFVSLIDGRRTLGEIIDAIHGEQVANLSVDEIRRECWTAMETLGRFDLLVVRHCSVPGLQAGQGSSSAEAA